MARQASAGLSDEAASGASTMVLPSDIMDIVLKYCDTTTRLAVLLSCRDYHAMAVPHVYRSITIRDPRQLRSFISIAQQAEFDERVASPFYHTRAFHYRVKNGTSAVSSSRIKQPRLYTTLRDIPSHTSSGRLIFPNLSLASFEQVPSSDGADATKTTFLSNVKTVHLKHSPTSVHDCPPDFHTLGMCDVREIHMYHLAGCEVNQESFLGTFLSYQACLEKVYFHLSSHFDNVIGSNERDTAPARTLVDGILQVMGTAYPRRSLDTTIYIHEYADAAAMLSASVAYAQLTAHSRHHRVYPSLRVVIVDIGSDAMRRKQNTDEAVTPNSQEDTNRQLLLKRCKKQMLKYRERAQSRHVQATHVPEDQQDRRDIMPDIYLLEGENRPGWLLTSSIPDTQPSSPAHSSHTLTWKKVEHIPK